MGSDAHPVCGGSVTVDRTRLSILTDRPVISIRRLTAKETGGSFEMLGLFRAGRLMAMVADTDLFDAHGNYFERDIPLGDTGL